jgi:hypothetical protein
VRAAFAPSLASSRAPRVGMASSASSALNSWNASITALVGQLSSLESGVSTPVGNCDLFLAQYYQACAAYLQTVTLAQLGQSQGASGGAPEKRVEAALSSHSQALEVAACAIMAFPYAFMKCDLGFTSTSMLSPTSPVSGSLGLACLQVADGVNDDRQLTGISKWLCSHSLKEAVTSLLTTYESRVVTCFSLYQIPQRPPPNASGVAADSTSVLLQNIVHGSPILACAALDDNIMRFTSPLQFAFTKAVARTAKSTTFF